MMEMQSLSGASGMSWRLRFLELLHMSVGWGFPNFFFFNLRFTLSTACHRKKILAIFHLICAERMAPSLSFG